MWTDFRSTYAESMMPYIVGSAFAFFLRVLSYLFAALGGYDAADVLAWTAAFVGAGCFVIGLFEFFDQRAINGHRIERMRIENELLKRDLMPAEPVVAPAAPVAFATALFVHFIWDHRHEDGMFPTLDECVSLGGFKRGRAQMSYQLIERAGALVDRIEGVQAGRPAKDWPRERYLEAAKLGGYTPDPIPLPNQAEKVFGMSVTGTGSTDENAGKHEET